MSRRRRLAGTLVFDAVVVVVAVVIPAIAGCSDDPAVGRDLEGRDAGPGPCVDVTPVRLSDGPGPHVRPGLAYNDGVFGVAWSEGGDASGRIRFLAVTPEGLPAGPAVHLSDVGPAMSPRVAAAAPGDGFGVVWYAGGGHADDIFFARVSGAGRPLGAERGISEQAGWSYAASLAFVDDAFVAVWLDERRGGLQAFGRAIGTDGHPAGPIVQLTHDAERAARPAVVAGPKGDGSVLVWTRWPDGHDPILVSRLDETLSAGTPAIVADDDAPASHPAVLLVGGSQALVAWDDEPGGRVFVRVVDIGETIAPGPAARVVARGARAKQPTLAGGSATGGPVGLFWSDAEETSDGLRDLRFRLLETDGTPTGPTLTISPEPGDDLQAVAAWDGRGFGVTWFRSGPRSEAVYYAHVDPACGP